MAIADICSTKEISYFGTSKLWSGENISLDTLKIPKDMIKKVPKKSSRED